MKKLLLTLTCITLIAGTAFSQTSSFAFNDNNGVATAGTYNSTDTFTLSLAGTISGMTTGFLTDGYSLWIEAPTASSFNTALTITGRTYFQFSDGTQNTYPKLFTDSVGAHSGFLSDQQGTLSGDLGATANNAGEQTGNASGIHLADYTFSLSGAAPGVYTIFTTNVSPKQSEISFNDGSSFLTANAPQAAYTITINAVPEPATWSLLGLGGLASVGLNVLRRRRA